MRTVDDLAAPLFLDGPHTDWTSGYNDGLRALVDAGEGLGLIVIPKALATALAENLRDLPSWILEVWPAARELIVEMSDG